MKSRRRFLRRSAALALLPVQAVHAAALPLPSQVPVPLAPEWRIPRHAEIAAYFNAVPRGGMAAVACAGILSLVHVLWPAMAREALSRGVVVDRELFRRMSALDELAAFARRHGDTAEGMAASLYLAGLPGFVDNGCASPDTLLFHGVALMPVIRALTDIRPDQAAA